MDGLLSLTKGSPVLSVLADTSGLASHIQAAIESFNISSVFARLGKKMPSRRYRRNDATINKSQRPGWSYRRGKNTVSRPVIMADVCRYKWPSPPWAETLYTMYSSPEGPSAWKRAVRCWEHSLACIPVDPEWLRWWSLLRPLSLSSKAGGLPVRPPAAELLFHLTAYSTPDPKERACLARC